MPTKTVPYSQIRTTWPVDTAAAFYTRRDLETQERVHSDRAPLHAAFDVMSLNL